MRTRRLGTLLVSLGACIFLASIAFLPVSDFYFASGREREAALWMKAQAAPPRRISVPSRIEPEYLLEIPKIRLRAVVPELEPYVFSGRNTPKLRRYGLGQVPYTAKLRNVSPGNEGTAAIAGHRTTYGAPLRNLHLLGPGDTILLRKNGYVQRWEVVHLATVPANALYAIRSSPRTRRLAILACSPPFSARNRVIVYAKLVSEGGE